MKKITLLCTVVGISGGFSVSLNAYDIFPITEYSTTDREGVINLSSSYRPQMTATLDCSSFFMGITYYYPQGQNQFLNLYEDECYDIYETIAFWFQYDETACLLVNFKDKKWNLAKGADQCDQPPPRY